MLEKSYPGEIAKPVSIVEWMDNEMEGKAPAKDCLELTKADSDMTEYFYHRKNLPRYRENGKKSAPCYFRKVPGYVPYPATTAMLDFKQDEDGKPLDFQMNGYDLDDVYVACVDAASGGKLIKRAHAREFCTSFLGYKRTNTQLKKRSLFMSVK